MQPVPELIGAPYNQPKVRIGDWIDDEVHGLIEVGGWTSARISWPRRKKTGRHSLILTPELTRAVRTESVESICYWWGVGFVTVWAWRRALGIGRITKGTKKLLQTRTGVPPEAAAIGRKRAASLESRSKMAKTKTGVPAHPATKAALLKAVSSPKPAGWGIKASAWMRKGKSK